MERARREGKDEGWNGVVEVGEKNLMEMRVRWRREGKVARGEVETVEAESERVSSPGTGGGNEFS